MNIGNIKAQIAAVLDQCGALGDDEALRADMLEGCTDIDSVLAALVEQEADAACMKAAIGERIAALRERADRYEAKREATRGAMLAVMEAAGLTKFTLPEATISVRATPPKLVEVDAAETPAAYTRTVVEPVKDEIKKALASGVEVAGWTLSNGSQSVTIRVR